MKQPKSRHALVVESDHDLRSRMQKSCQAAGYTVTAVSAMPSGYVPDWVPDIVLLSAETAADFDLPLAASVPVLSLPKANIDHGTWVEHLPAVEVETPELPTVLDLEGLPPNVRSSLATLIGFARSRPGPEYSAVLSRTAELLDRIASSEGLTEEPLAATSLHGLRDACERIADSFNRRPDLHVYLNEAPIGPAVIQALPALIRRAFERSTIGTPIAIAYRETDRGSEIVLLTHAVLFAADEVESIRTMTARFGLAGDLVSAAQDDDVRLLVDVTVPSGSRVVFRSIAD